MGQINSKFKKTRKFTVPEEKEKLEIIEVFDSSGFKGYGTRDAYTDSKHKFQIDRFKFEGSEQYKVGVCTIEMVDGRAVLKDSWLLEMPSKKLTHKEHLTTSSVGEAETPTPPKFYRPRYESRHCTDLPSQFVIKLDLDEGVLSFRVKQYDLGVAFKNLKQKNLHLVFLDERTNCEIQIRKFNDSVSSTSSESDQEYLTPLNELKNKLKEQKRKQKAEKKAAKKISKKKKQRRSPSSSELESSDSDSDSRSRSKKRDKKKKMRKSSKRKSSKSDSD